MPTSFMPVGGIGSTEGVLNTFTLEGVSEFSLFRTITNTTATREIHGDEVIVRRPILQEVELVDDNERAVLHFDRRVLKNEIPGLGFITSNIAFQYKLALWDPITIKSVETNYTA